MTETLRWLIALLAAYLLADVATLVILLVRRRPAPPSEPLRYPVDRDACHPLPDVGDRPLRPYTADEEQIIATVWGAGTRVLSRLSTTPERN